MPASLRIPERIETARLVLRRPEMRDLDAYVSYYTGPRTAGVGGALTVIEATDRFFAMAGQWALRGYGRYVMCENDGVGFGHTGVLQITDDMTPELTWTLWDTTREGHGFATEAARAALEASRPACRSLVALIHEENHRSIAVAQRLGFEQDMAAEAPSWMNGALTFKPAEAAQ